MRVCIIRFISVFLISLFAITPALAGSSIRDSSIAWENQAARAQLMSGVPEWDNEALTNMFTFYTSGNMPFSSSKDERHFNTQFINTFWGPLANPFSKYARPAKAFVFLSSGTYYMAPVVKNLADGNYYVFVKSQKRPTVLSEWVTNLATANGNAPVQFNVCNGYGSLPTDSCADKSYQAESSDALNSRSGKRLAAHPAPSAKRDMLQDWRTKIRASLTGGSIYESSISWNGSKDSRNALLATVNTWPNYRVIQENFEKLRDIRYFSDTSVTNFARRISWLYPDDGCWTRASAVAKDLFGVTGNPVSQYGRPSKVFAFGNLCVNTTNSHGGSVSWWYHTAPVIRDAETNMVYVLDPAVDPYKPSPIEKWMADISSRTGACKNSSGSVEKFNVCNGFGSTPYSQCKGSFEEEANDTPTQIHYQGSERQRQASLGRNADAVLGHQPPWKN